MHQPPFSFCHTFSLDLPDWLRSRQVPELIPDLEQRMRLMLELAWQNTIHKSGGPFAAGVFEQDSGRVVAIGVNRVEPLSCSSAHAEIMALSLAQKKLASYDLAAADLPAHQLVVNWSPCLMCYGAVLWSGIRSLVIAGQGEPMEEITGFDEGPLPADWRGELRKRGIDLTEGLLREESLAIFQQYAATGAKAYNPSRANI